MHDQFPQQADSGVFFSSDCFGALLQAVPQSAADLSETDLRDGQVLWATIDSPWLHKVDKDAFARELDGIRKIAQANPSRPTCLPPRGT